MTLHIPVSTPCLYKNSLLGHSPPAHTLEPFIGLNTRQETPTFPLHHQHISQSSPTNPMICHVQIHEASYNFIPYPRYVLTVDFIAKKLFYTSSTLPKPQMLLTHLVPCFFNQSPMHLSWHANNTYSPISTTLILACFTLI